MDKSGQDPPDEHSSTGPVAELSAQLAACSTALGPFLNRADSQSLLSGLARKQQATLRGQLADTLDNMLGVYTKFMSGSAEDRLIAQDVDNLRGYFKRVRRSSESGRTRAEVDRAPAKRFVTQGTNLSPGGSGPKRTRLTEAEIEQKVQEGRDRDKVQLPEIRQVVKGHQESESESDNDELKVHDD